MGEGRAVMGFMAAAASLMLLPAAAAADLYCVDTGPGGCDHTGYAGTAGLQQALTDAQNHSGDDQINLGAATYATPDQDGFNYADTASKLTLAGFGPGSTFISVPTPAQPPGPNTDFFEGLHLSTSGAASLEIRDFSVMLPTPAGTGMFQAFRAIDAGFHTTASSIAIVGPVAQINSTGMVVGSGTLSDISIALPIGIDNSLGVQAVAATSDDLTVEDSDIQADTGVSYSNSLHTGLALVRRTSLATPGTGVWAEDGDARVEDSLIDVGSGTGYGLLAEFGNINTTATSTVVADGVTVVAASGNSATGARAAAPDNNALMVSPDSASIQIRNSIIDLDFANSLRRTANHGNAANISIDYSDYDSTAATDDPNLNGATGTITAGSQNVGGPAGVDPMFVNAMTGNFHLQSGSPLIDLGDPAAPAIGRMDIDGHPRAVLGTAGCQPRRDIGADERVPLSPITPVCAPPSSGGSTAASTTAAVPTRKKCKKGRKLKRGRCVKKKKKK